MGRPSDFNQEIADEITDTIACSPEMVETLCEKNPHWPAPCTIYRWRKNNLKFREDYTLAKQEQIETLVSRIFLITRDANNDFYETNNGKAVNSAHISRTRTEVDAIKWLAGKLAPKIYGDKIEKTNDDETKTLMQKVIDKL